MQTRTRSSLPSPSAPNPLTMSLSVTKSSQCMIRPAEPTPFGTLDLSAIDQLPGLRCKVKTFHVFRHGHEPATVIKDALSKALVPYYPLAGRLVESSRGELQIACTGEGVWLIEASANCNLEAVNYLSHPLLPCYDELLPDPRPEIDPSNILVLMQVTQFMCGGFVIGLEFCHSICDGLGAAQFLNAIGEFARGLNAPSIEPVWFREAIPTPPRLSYGSHEARSPPPVPSYRLEQATVDVSLDHIGCFKSHFFELTRQRCSVFEILVATVWQCRTQAISLDPNVNVRLVFFANARPLVQPELPKGFYGNCFFPVSVVVPSGKLVSASIAEVVNMIKEAKAKLPDDFARWAASEGEDPYVPTLSYSTFFVSEWSRLGFGQVDYGWGTPVQVVPLTYSDIIPVCILGSPPAPAKGARLITQCVEEAHLAAFLDRVIVNVAQLER